MTKSDPIEAVGSRTTITRSRAEAVALMAWAGLALSGCWTASIQSSSPPVAVVSAPVSSAPVATGSEAPRFPTEEEVVAEHERYRRAGFTSPLTAQSVDCGAHGLLLPTTTCLDARLAAIQLYERDVDLRGAGSDCGRDEDCPCGAVPLTGNCPLSGDYREGCVGGHCVRAPVAAFAPGPAFCPPLTTIVVSENGPGRSFRPTVGIFSPDATRGARGERAGICCYDSTPVCPWVPRNNE
jgi:hypothetical protein